MLFISSGPRFCQNLSEPFYFIEPEAAQSNHKATEAFITSYLSSIV